MKRTTTLLVSALVLGVTAMTANAVTTVQSSKSNSSSYRVDPNNPDSTEAACKQKGGKIYTDASGAKICVLPGAKVTTVSSSKSNASQFREVRITEAECKAKGGQVLTDAAGGKICVLPDPVAAPAPTAPTPPKG